MSAKVRFCIYILSVIFLFFICQLTLKGIGAGSSERNAFLFMCFILLLSFSRKIFWCVAFPVFLVQALYIPVGMIFGLPTYQSIASVLATNLLETKEFLDQITFVNLLYSAGLILAMVAFRYVYARFKLNLHRNNVVIFSFALLSFFSLDSSVFFKESYSSVNNLQNISNDLSHYSNNWNEVTVTNKDYDTYVLIIGESVRSDYMSVYGYPLNNSPFMSTHGLVVNGLLAGGSNTVASLSAMLTRNVEGVGDFNKNIVDLANSAGFKTYWLSNQGFISDFDTPISLIANNSSQRDFTKYGAFNSANTSDFLLIDKFKNALADNTNKRKFIVVHLYGSHPNPCARVEDFPAGFKTNDRELNYLSCYVNSIKKTDEIIATLRDSLNKQYENEKRAWSLVYFADHGLVHKKIKKEIRLVHNESMGSYNVPLFTISSDNEQSRKCDSLKSGLNFIDGLASWMGVQEESLNRDYRLFDCKDDPDAAAYLERLRPEFVEDSNAIDVSG